MELPDQPFLPTEQAVHQIEGGLPALHAPRLALIERPLQIDHVIAGGGHVWLVAVLLPEQQLVDLGLHEGIVRQQRAAARQVADDGIRLGEAAAKGKRVRDSGVLVSPFMMSTCSQV
jgi:hypothetical protein